VSKVGAADETTAREPTRTTTASKTARSFLVFMINSSNIILAYTNSSVIISQVFANVNTQNTELLLYILYKYCVFQLNEKIMAKNAK
jgi:hypothetical protein